MNGSTSRDSKSPRDPESRPIQVAVANSQLRTILRLCAPFLRIKNALALRETSADCSLLVNEMPWYDLQTAVDVRLAPASLRCSEGLMLRSSMAAEATGAAGGFNGQLYLYCVVWAGCRG